jgi:pyruvate/2-oxoglutarate dehydrogenase complex dihydrolipoamide dehydrogenase (E3) component
MCKFTNIFRITFTLCAVSPNSQARGALSSDLEMLLEYHQNSLIGTAQTPTKTMVASARVAYLTNRGEVYGVDLKESFKMNMETVRKRKRDIVSSFRSGNESRLQKTENLDIFMGKARFVDSKRIEITMNDTKKIKEITGDAIFINTGCRPAVLDLPGVNEIKVLDSTSIMELDAVPAHLIVIGGGYIGVEFAQMFKRFGANVTIVQRSKQMIGQEDIDIAAEVKKILTEDGIEIILDQKPLLVHQSTNGEVEVKVTLSGTCTRTIRGSHLLMAAGRSPNTDNLSPETAGVKLDSRGFIKVNEYLETNVPGICALGDVKGGPQFTHISYDDFRIIRHNHITFPTCVKLSTTDRLVPYTVFMDPQLGRVGLTEAEALKIYSKDEIKVAKMPMAFVARALEMDESRGVMKAIVHVETKKILGGAILGIEGGELMSMLQIAMMGGVTYDKLQDAVFAHPCLSESLNNLWGFLE